MLLMIRCTHLFKPFKLFLIFAHDFVPKLDVSGGADHMKVKVIHTIEWRPMETQPTRNQTLLLGGKYE